MWENWLNSPNNLEHYGEIHTWSAETETILEAVREAHLKALEWGSETFTWEDIEDILSKSWFASSFIWYYWFRVMMFGRNATKEETEQNPNGPTSRYTGSQALDDTGGFISTEVENDITEENYRVIPLKITEKTEKIIYRV